MQIWIKEWRERQVVIKLRDDRVVITAKKGTKRMNICNQLQLMQEITRHGSTGRVACIEDKYPERDTYNPTHLVEQLYLLRLILLVDLLLIQS